MHALTSSARGQAAIADPLEAYCTLLCNYADRLCQTKSMPMTNCSNPRSKNDNKWAQPSSIRFPSLPGSVTGVSRYNPAWMIGDEPTGHHFNRNSSRHRRLPQSRTVSTRPIATGDLVRPQATVPISVLPNLRHTSRCIPQRRNSPA